MSRGDPALDWSGTMKAREVAVRLSRIAVVLIARLALGGGATYARGTWRALTS